MSIFKKRGNMVIKLDKYDNYGLYSEICTQHGFPNFPLANIDEILAFREGYSGDTLYICLFWNTGSKMCMIGFPMSNKDIPYTQREGKLDTFIKEIGEYADEKGYNLIWTTSGTNRVLDSLLSNDFVIGDNNIHLCLKGIKK